jgi:Eco57I restriction-modification methylase
MPLERALNSIHALPDLPQLVAELGHEPLWAPLDPAGLLLPGTFTITAAAVVGQAGDFTWLGLACDDPARTARGAARQLADRGRIGAVLGLDTGSRRLAVSASLDQTPVLEIDLVKPSRHATSCLARLGGAVPGGALALVARAVEVLSGEGIGRHFFLAFRATLDRIVSTLPVAVPRRERRALALLQLTRVLFLYFVQVKGWLNGSDRFLRERLDDCLFRRRSVHRDLLAPLFFGTLNQPPAARGRTARAFGRIPFLNGGLFEPHPLERLHRVVIPSDAWRDAFDVLFERYHFTVVEDAPGSAIAPDMLGKVFEGVMEPDERRASGTYYTPPGMVHNLLDAGLAAFVAGRIGSSEANALRRLERGDPRALGHLEDIAILDPAAGSGAFLLGALERLVTLRSPAAAPKLRRHILARNLYGVDLNPAAVRLTELRLWLAVIADEPDGDPEAVAPLPNLDAFVRQGDSLRDPLRLLLKHPVRASRLGSLLGDARHAAAMASGPGKREALRRLRQAELDAAAERLERAIGVLERRARECLEAGRQRTLLGERRGLDRRLRGELAACRDGLRAIRASRRRLTADGTLPAFDFETAFADVMARGGFDVVIGNPPWVRAEALAPSFRHELRDRFRWWRAGTGRGYGHQPDLALAFLERGWELTAPGGVLAFLVPAKLATAAYGAVARAALIQQGTLLAAADLAAEEESFRATVYPLALVARRSPAPAGHRPRATLSPFTKATFSTPSPPESAWIIVRDPVQEALGAFRDLPPLSTRFTPRLGVKTGANHLFLNPTSDVEPDMLRPAVRGRDVRAFLISPTARIIWTHDRAGRVMERLPLQAAAHFRPHVGALARRRDAGRGPPWQLFRVAAGLPTPRVVWADLALRLEAAALAEGNSLAWIPLNSCYVICCGTPDEAVALSAWLNTTWMRSAARAVADPASGGYARFNARAISSLPLPATATSHPELLSLARKAADGAPVQGELDELSATILGLTRGARQALGNVVGVSATRGR